VLTIVDADESNKGALYDIILTYTSVCEEKYGVNETWDPLKYVILKVFQGFKDEIRELGIEIPVARYEMEYMLLDTLFGLKSSDFRKRRWIKGSVLVTNHNLIFPKEVRDEVIPLQAIATVCREIYVGYSAELARGMIRAIDYQVKATGMSCAVILAKDDLMNEFMKVTSILRAEYRRLSQNEAKILLALYDGAPIDQVYKRCSIDQQEVDKAFRRLVELNYSDYVGHLTSYGINAAVETTSR
jgi:hypothetical protein